MELKNLANNKKREMGIFAVDTPRFSSKGENNSEEINKSSERIFDSTISDADTFPILDEIHDSTQRLISDEESRLPKKMFKSMDEFL